MQKILEAVSNPYRKENYERLLNIYLNSNDYGEFYSSVVSFYDDRDYESKLEDSKASSKFLKIRSMGIWRVMSEFSDFFKTEHRIYINAPLNHVGTIVDKFISECESRNLPFELKYLTQNIKRNDSIVIGSNTESYEKHIEILRQFAQENPEIIEECGTPPMLTGTLDGWMGLADENVANRYISYTESRLKTFSKSINRYIYEHKELAKEINDSCISSIDDELADYDDLEEDEIQEIIDDYLEYDIESSSKLKLREYIKRNPEVIDGLYAEFFKECDKKEIDSENPTLYKGPRNKLFENDSKPKADITDEIREKMQNTPVTLITNMYLGSDNRESLSIESKVEIMKTIIEKNSRDRYEELNIYEDLNFLNTIGLVSDELMDEVNQTLYSKNTLKLLHDYNKQHLENFPSFPAKNTTLKQALESKDPILTDEEIKQKISTRMQSITEYFKNPIIAEQTERQIEYEQNLLKMYSKERTFPYELRREFEIHTDLLRDDISHLPEKQETKRKICSHLQEKNISDVDIKTVLNKIKARESDYEDIWL